MSIERAPPAEQLRQQLTRVALGRHVQHGATPLVGSVQIRFAGQQQNHGPFTTTAGARMPMQRRFACAQRTGQMPV